MKCSLAIPVIRRRCGIFSKRSKPNTVRPREPGFLIVASRPRKCSQRCATVSRRLASPSHALGILHPAHGSRGSLQKSERRFRDSPNFSSASPSHRGTHLHRLCDLLSSCHSAPALARLGARINSSCRPGEVQRDADDRCSSSHQRRPDHYPFALHAARGRSPAPAQTTQTGITRAATAQNHGLRPTGQIGLRSEDFLGAWVDFERLTIDVPLESAKSGSQFAEVLLFFRRKLPYLFDYFLKAHKTYLLDGLSRYK